MEKLSQNKKVGIAVLMVFMISFTAMVLFLDKESAKGGHASSANVLEWTDRGEDGLSLDGIGNFDLSPVPTFMVNPEGRLEYVNKAFCKLMSADCGVLEGNLLFDYVNSKDLPEMASINTKLFADGEEVDGVGPFRLNNGTREMLVLLSGTPVFAEEKVSHILFSAKDITEQVQELREEEDGESSEEDLYPKIRHIEDGDSDRLMVEKISYLEYNEKN